MKGIPLMPCTCVLYLQVFSSDRKKTSVRTDLFSCLHICGCYRETHTVLALLLTVVMPVCWSFSQWYKKGPAAVYCFPEYCKTAFLLPVAVTAK